MSLFKIKLPHEIILTDIIYYKKRCWQITEIRCDVSILTYSFYIEREIYLNTCKDVLLVKITDEIKYMPIEEIRCNKVN